MTLHFKRLAIIGVVLLTLLAMACGNTGTDSATAGADDPATGTKGSDDATPTAADGTLTATATSARNTTDIEWFGYDEGLSRAKNYGKKVFVNFYADWCRYCKQMDRTTFEDKRIIAYLNDNFVPVRINSDKKPKRAAEFGVKGLPVSWFLTETGERIGNQPGYLPAETLLPLLRFIYTDAYEKMGFNEFLKQM